MGRLMMGRLEIGMFSDGTFSDGMYVNRSNCKERGSDKKADSANLIKLTGRTKYNTRRLLLTCRPRVLSGY